MTQRPFNSKQDIYELPMEVSERKLYEIYDPTERTTRIPLGMSGLYMEWTDTGLVIRNEQPANKHFISGREFQEAQLLREQAVSFYANLGKVRSDKYVDPIVKVGSIETARRFPGSENFYNGKPGIVLEVKHGWEHFVFSLIGHAHAGRFLDEFNVDTEKGLVGKVVEILGEGGKEVQPEFGEPYKPLVQAYGIRPAKRFM